MKEQGIQTFGAGRSKKEAEQPALVKEQDDLYVIIGFGWSVIGCKRKKKSDLYINQLEENNVLMCLDNARKQFKNAKIICFFHWDYELEIFPQPLHRMVAQKAIDRGAYAVIGCHPHIVQPIELYKNRIIAYSLGNFIVPNSKFGEGKLIYPEISMDELVVQLDDRNQYLHFKYDGEKTINMLDNYDLDDIIAPFNNSSNKDYYKWFRKYRRKKKFLPIFYRSSMIEYNLKCAWVDVRGKIIEGLLRINLKSGPS